MARNAPREDPKTLRQKFAALQLRARRMMAVTRKKEPPRPIVTAPFVVEEEHEGYSFAKDLRRSREVWGSGLVLALLGVLFLGYTGEYPMSGRYGILAQTLNPGGAEPAVARETLPAFLRVLAPVADAAPAWTPAKDEGEMRKISVDLVLLFVGILSTVQLITACTRMLTRAQEELRRNLAIEDAARQQDPTSRAELTEATQKKWADFENENKERAEQGRPPKRMRVGVQRIFTEKHLTNFLVSVLCAWIVIFVLPLHALAPFPMRAYCSLSVMSILIASTVIAGWSGTAAVDKFCGIVANFAYFALGFFFWRAAS